MISIPQIRESANKIIVLGNHEPIIQSILDFDYLSGKKEGSVVGIVTGRRGFAKYFWGRSEILIPTLLGGESLQSSSPSLWLLNLLSGRRTLSSTLEFFRGLSSTGDLAEGQVGTAKLGGVSLLEFIYNDFNETQTFSYQYFYPHFLHRLPKIYRVFISQINQLL